MKTLYCSTDKEDHENINSDVEINCQTRGCEISPIQRNLIRLFRGVNENSSVIVANSPSPPSAPIYTLAANLIR